jgi:glycogen synthase
MSWALDTAMEWYAQPALWDRLVRNGMRCDFSWESQAREYLELFVRLLGGAKQPSQVKGPMAT